VTDLERLVQQIFQSLSAKDPAQVRRPLTLAELTGTIIPYRTARRALQLETSEDYELAIMRLCAGEGGFARMEQEDIRGQFAEQVRSSNPDLGLLRQHGNASLRLDVRIIEQVTARDPHQSFAPRQPAQTVAKSAASRKTPAKRRKAAEDAGSSGPDRCRRCRSDLPEGRVVNFCPHCGFDLRRGYCPQCNAELERDWRHCVSCGHTLPKD
jgi:hypothetical protein